MITENDVYNHPLFIKYKKQLIHELKFNNIPVDNVDELAKEGVRLVLSIDKMKSKKALNYIKFYSNVDIQTMLRVFMGKELSQIIYDISDRNDSVVDYFGWVTLAIILGVEI
jgi:hypothetical protein